MKIERSRLILGVILLLFGIFLLLERMNFFGGEFFLLFVGVSFISVFYITGKVGFLIPGALVSGLGIGVFLLDAIKGDEAVDLLIIFGSLAIGFYLVSLLGGRKVGLWPLVPGSILLFIALFLYALGSPEIRSEIGAAVEEYWAAGLILIGVLVLVRAFRPARK